MWEGIAGALVSAGAKLIPGLIGDSSDRKSEAQFDWNAKFQDDLAKRGVTWRGRDVMNAYAETGIHPLSLLGTNPASFSPVVSSGVSSGGNWRKGIGDAGQDIGRAISATSGRDERDMLTKLAVDRAGLENELIKTRIASEIKNLNAPGSPPAMPIAQRYLLDGQGQAARGIETGSSGLVKVEPSEVTATSPGSPGSEPGVNPDVKFLRTNDGGLAPVKGKRAQEGLEDDWLGNLWWNWRNRVDTPKSMLPRLPAGKVWEWDINRGAYYPVNARRDSREMLNRFKRGW